MSSRINTFDFGSDFVFDNINALRHLRSSFQNPTNRFRSNANDSLNHPLSKSRPSDVAITLPTPFTRPLTPCFMAPSMGWLITPVTPENKPFAIAVPPGKQNLIKNTLKFNRQRCLLAEIRLWKLRPLVVIRLRQVF